MIDDRPTARSHLSSARPIPRRGLSRVEAAMYVGVSVNKFDDLVEADRMPKPRKIDSRKIWDVYEIDTAFDALPREHADPTDNTWDGV
jgi:predicted DNA-binding transcriptional regulator AlpA